MKSKIIQITNNLVKRLLPVYLFTLLPLSASAQGIPFIRNYMPEEYHGNNMNFDIETDEKGNILVANFEGLMYYDHAQWRIIRTPGITRVTVVYKASNDVIWVGGYNYFGKVVVENNGKLNIKRVGEPELFIGEVSEIYEKGPKLQFIVSTGAIYEVDDNKVKEVKSIDKNLMKIGMMDVVDVDAIEKGSKDLVKNDTVKTEELGNGLLAILPKSNGMRIANEKTSSSFSITDKNGVRPITEADKKRILDVNTRYSEEGLRVLAFAYKESDEALTLETEQGYTFIGLVSMIDPPREESRQAVADAIRAGIKPIMITGDHKVTASAIARQIGIMRDGDISVTGMELDAMSDDELDKVLEKISVYARVSPENKIRIVEAWQRKGNIVSMTGDGVNDAPALKKADIGVAMGITGTEVSKDAASMILQDDNFATIIKAVANGRNVYR